METSAVLDRIGELIAQLKGLNKYVARQLHREHGSLEQDKKIRVNRTRK